MTAGTAFKVLTADQWMDFEREGLFHRADGYIHMSTAEQLAETLAKHFAGQQGLVIAEVDLAQLGKAVRWEESRGGQLFPHLYGTLPMTAVVRVESRD
jgi:uncharacterized protein (DUF952 family)